MTLISRFPSPSISSGPSPARSHPVRLLLAEKVPLAAAFAGPDLHSLVMVTCASLTATRYSQISGYRHYGIND